MVIAAPATAARRAEIGAGTLYHVTNSRHRAEIVTAMLPGTGFANCMVDLKAMQGYSVTPFRLLRDYSVLDANLADPKNWGQYLYFFLGEPGAWAVKKNLGLSATWGNLGPDALVIAVRGADLLSRNRIVFYRPDDRVVVVRGGFVGPARI